MAPELLALTAAHGGRDLRVFGSVIRGAAGLLLEGRMVVIIYTQRSFSRQIISMRKANAREQLRFRHHFS